MINYGIFKKGISLFATGIIACAVSLTAVSAYCPADVSAAPVKNTVTDGRSYSGNWSTTDKNYIVPLGDGGYMTFVTDKPAFAITVALTTCVSPPPRTIR